MLKPITFAVLALFVGACSNSTPAPTDGDSSPSRAATGRSAAAAGLPDRDPQLAKQLVSEGAVLIDVRTQPEWDAGHIEGANHIPLQQLDARLSDVDTLAGGDKDKPVVLYCQSGGRAARAKDKLLKAGYTKVTNMGGIADWPKDGMDRSTLLMGWRSVRC